MRIQYQIALEHLPIVFAKDGLMMLGFAVDPLPVAFHHEPALIPEKGKVIPQRQHACKIYLNSVGHKL